MTSIDQSLIIALAEPDRYKVREWNCPKCQKAIAWLWSTSIGRLIEVIIPPEQVATTEQLKRRRLLVGIDRGVGGWSRYVAAVDEGDRDEDRRAM